MADDTVDETVAPEPVAEAQEPVEAPEVEQTPEAVVDTPESPAAPEADSEGSTEPEVASPEPAESPPLTIETLRGMSQKERIAYLRENAPEVAGDLEYAGAQREKARLEREAGSREQTAERLKAIRERLLANPDADAEDLNFLDANNYANAAQRHFVEWGQAWKQAFEATAEDQARIDAAAAEGNAVKYAAVVLDTAAKRLGSQAVYQGSVEDIPADTPLAKSIVAARQKAIESELKAAELEAKGKRDPAPAVTGGRVAGSDPQIDPESSWSAASQAYNLGQIDSERYGNLASKFGVKLR